MPDPLTIVFTDLDGCLLDHHSYDHRPAEPALHRLRALGIPLIPVTSKTAAEIDALDVAFGAVPKISENGMAISLPDGFFAPPYHKAGHHAPGKGYQEICSFIDQLPAELRAAIHGFRDMSVEEVMAATGLDHAAATRAKDRQASEPFLWRGTAEQFTALDALVRQAGLKLTEGGRFRHLLSQGGKETAVDWLLARFRESHPDHTFISIALGDSENDRAMLSAADYGIIIPNKDGSGLEIKDAAGEIIRAQEAGPRGWSAALLALLERLEAKEPQQDFIPG